MATEARAADSAEAEPVERKLDALPDTIDFRDTMYAPALIEVPPGSDLEGYRKAGIPVLDQGRDGACTGYALATVANYLLRVRGRNPKADKVSAWMLYTMAKRYDEFPGEDYSGSSARGAIKGWYKHGLCAWKFWEHETPDPELADKRSADAIERPLGAYYRVNHKDLVAMHAAINEVGILFATAAVHLGWQQLKPGEDTIPFSQDPLGGHAFAIVGYDREGFWIQNSWGVKWGQKGLARLTYADWLSNGSDVWVAALGAPVHLAEPVAGAAMRAGAPMTYQAHVVADLKPFIIPARNDGVLDQKGDYGLTIPGLDALIGQQMPAKMAGWAKKRVLLYAHGGLVPMDSAVQTVANNREPLLQAQVYPLSFIWRSDAWTSLKDILQDAVSRRRDEAFLDRAKDFMLDRLDDTLEPATRLLGGKALWDEMKENATGATTNAQGAARLAADRLAALHAKGGIDELHLVGHSAGSIFHAPLAQYLAAKGVPIESLTLWAPACTVDLFESAYRPLIDKGAIKAFRIYTMDDATERNDNCANIYHKSLLYLVSAAFEARPRIPGIRDIGVPILGMQHDLDTDLAAYLDAGPCRWFLAPGTYSRALHHGDFDNDPTTLLSTLHAILGEPADEATQRAAFAAPRASQDQRRRMRDKLDVALTS